MVLSDKKKVQSFIQGILPETTRLELTNTNLQSMKTKWQNHNPDVTGSNLTSQNVTDANALITAVASVLSDHAAIITTLKSKNVGSHGTGALD